MIENILAIRARRVFIRASKAIPFVLCALILVSYSEIFFALATNDFVMYDGYMTPYVPFSWLIGNYFEYSIPFLIGMTVIVYAVETCIWNKLSCLYIGIALAEKDIFNSMELYIEYVYIIVIANIIVSGIFVIKGIKLLIKAK